MRTQDVPRGQTFAPPTDVATLEVDGRYIQTDVEGYLLDVSDWDRQVSEEMAARDGVELTPDHWILIDFLHRFYREFQVAPEMPILTRCLCKDQGDCRWDRKFIKQLFPLGAKSACRYAGLPAPVGRSCG
jgi:tRNA 2-thiouridine synthesizing protein E